VATGIFRLSCIFTPFQPEIPILENDSIPYLIIKAGFVDIPDEIIRLVL